MVSLDGLSDGDLSRAVMQAMWPLPQLVVTGVVPVTQGEIDNARQRCLALREWLGQQSMSKRIRLAYEHWIEFCEKSIVDAENELRTGRKRREFEEGQKRLQQESQRASSVRAALNLPRPPR